MKKDALAAAEVAIPGILDLLSVLLCTTGIAAAGPPFVAVDDALYRIKLEKVGEPWDGFAPLAPL